jgi:lipocalin
VLRLFKNKTKDKNKKKTKHTKEKKEIKGNNSIVDPAKTNQMTINFLVSIGVSSHYFKVEVSKTSKASRHQHSFNS